jgi:hypothetical protein
MKSVHHIAKFLSHRPSKLSSVYVEHGMLEPSYEDEWMACPSQNVLNCLSLNKLYSPLGCLDPERKK